MLSDEKEIYTEWLAAAPKGVRWDRAQEMWEEYKRKRQERADEVVRRLLGNSKMAEKVRCPSCYGAFPEFCKRCDGIGEVDA